eukprot:XP_019917938.1 PREDICTED: platelet endothelial aggregation receptor 1-like [Crassostrea gigas]
MILKPWIIVLCCLNIFSGACKTAFDTGHCKLPNSSSIRCCTGFYLSENKCKECDPGFVGENCSLTCPPGHFGLKCRERCQCSWDMYCDPIRGCVCNTTSVNCTDPEHESTQEMTINPTTVQPVKRKHYLHNNIHRTLFLKV